MRVSRQIFLSTACKRGQMKEAAAAVRQDIDAVVIRYRSGVESLAGMLGPGETRDRAALDRRLA